MRTYEERDDLICGNPIELYNLLEAAEHEWDSAITDIEAYVKINQQLQQTIKDISELSVYIYNMGYGQGHNDTVESCYTDVLPVDARTYHEDVVVDLIADNRSK